MACQASVKSRVQKATRKALGLNGGGAGAYGDGQEGRFGFTAYFDSGMEELGKGFDASDEARTRPRKVAIGFERVDASIADGGHGVPRIGKIDREVFVTRPLCAVAAGGNEKNVRFSFDDILQTNA